MPKSNVLSESSERRISRWIIDIQQYIGNPAEMTRFEKIPRVHKYRKVGNYYEKTD